MVDEAGNMIVADDGKMQVVSNDQEFLGVVKVGELDSWKPLLPMP